MSLSPQKHLNNRILMNIENTTLDNGLNTLFIDSPNSNVTTAQIWFKAGSSLEDKDNKGIAHFLEHMFFKGTQKYPDMMIAKTVESYGGELNAFTSFDYTCYYINGPATETLTTIDVLMDMVSNPEFREEDLIPEKAVVFEEYRRSIDSSSQYNFFKIQDGSFPKDYKSPILGTEETIKAFSREQLVEFRNKFYNLENALLIVAGNLKQKDKIVKLINTFEMPHGTKSKFSKFKLKTKANITVHDKTVNQATLTMAIQSPGYTDSDSPAEDLAINCLAFGDISPLYKDLVSKDSMASGVNGSTMFFSEGGCHFLRFACPVENIEKVLTQFPKTVKNVFNDGFSQDAIDRIRNQYIASKVYEKESIESFAFGLGHGFAQSGNIDCEEDFIKQMKLISRSKVKKSLTEIFSREIHVTVQLPKGHPKKLIKEKAQKFTAELNKIARSEKVKKSNHIIMESKFDTEAKCIELRKGIKLVYRQNQLTPTFAMHAYIKGGLSYETDANNGVFNLISKNITYGHKKAKYEELKNELDKKSSYINGFSGRNAYGLTLHGLSEYTDELVSHFLSLLTQPTFPPQYFKLEKELIKRTLFNQKEDPVKHCFNQFNKFVFNGHPYSREIIGTEDSVKKLTRKSLIDLHNENLMKQEIVLTYCGDLDLETVVEKITPHLEIFKSRKPTKKKQKNTINPQNGNQVSIEFDREQTHIMIGKPSYKVDSIEDLYLKMFTTFLAGQSSELFVEVRDKRGLCYSVQPLQNTSLEAGYWGIYIGAGHDKKEEAIEAIKEILNKYQKNGFKKKDFDLIKKMIQGQNLLNVQTNEDYANFYSIAVLHDLGFDYQHESFKKIDNMKLADFNSFLKKFLIDEWNIIDVGRSN
jgi:zinc protease